MTGATFSIIEHTLKDITAVIILSKLEEKGKKYRLVTKNLLVWCTISGHIFELLCDYNPVVAKKPAVLEEELVRLRHKNTSLQATVDHMHNEEAENKRLIFIGENWIS